MKLRLFALMVVVSATAFADDPITYIGTSTATGSGNKSDDITNVAKWGDGVSPLSPECDYQIINDRYCGFGGTGSFPGRSLTLGAVGGTSGNLEARSATTFNFGNLVLNNGRIHSGLGDSAAINIEGSGITVNASSSAPFVIHSTGGYNSTINFFAPFHGSGCMRLRKWNQSSDTMRMRLKSDMSDYTGTITIGEPGSSYNTAKYRTMVLFGDVTMAGTVNLSPNGVIGACGVSDYIGEFTVSNLSFSSGSMIRMSVNDTTGGTIRVANTLTLPASGTITIDVIAMPNYNLSARRHPIIIAPAGSGLTKDLFKIDTVKNAGAELYGKLLNCELSVDTSSPDCEILYLEMPKYTAHKRADGYGNSCWMPEYSTNWYGVAANTPLDPDTIYLGYLRAMQTPTKPKEAYSVFAGKKLVFSGRELEFDYSATINDFTVLNGADVRFRYYGGAHLYGNVCITNFHPTTGIAAIFSSCRNQDAYIDARLYGPGNVKIFGTKYGTYATSSAVFYITADNSDFSGKMTVDSEQISPATNTTLRITAANQLGGARSEFAYDALKLLNWSRLRADASLDLNEPTRGVYFLGGNYVYVYAATNTLTLSTQTTLAGTRVKEGSGTLALGGTLKFTSEQSDTPTEGTNVLQVSAGRIRPASKTGADGLAISFASGTGLRLAPVAETDPDVSRYGLYDVKWATPFDLSATDGKLDVALDLPADRREMPHTMSFGVCTVPTAAASALNGNIMLPSIRGYNLVVDAVDNGDDTVTFTANYSKRGLVFIVE